MSHKALFLLALVLTPSFFAAESIPKPEPLWSVKLEGAGPAPLWADAERVIVSDRAAGLAKYGCFQAADGKRKWWVPGIPRFDPQKASPFEPCESFAAPQIYQSKAAFLYSNGKFQIIQLTTGKILFDPLNLAEDYDARAPLKGYASSPLFYEGKLFLSPGAQDASIIALNPDTCELIWKTPGRRASRADFIGAEFGGIKQLVGFDHDSLGGWAVDSGKRLWQLDTPDRAEDAVETLFETRGRLLVSTSDGVSALHGFTQGGAIDEKPVARNDVSRGLVVAISGGMALGIGGGVYALDLEANLRERWRIDETAFPGASWLLMDGARVFVLAEDGRLGVFEFSAEKAERIALFKLSDSIVAKPAIAGGKLFIRASTRLLCFELKTLGLSK